MSEKTCRELRLSFIKCTLFTALFSGVWIHVRAAASLLLKRCEGSLCLKELLTPKEFIGWSLNEEFAVKADYNGKYLRGIFGEWRLKDLEIVDIIGNSVSSYQQPQSTNVPTVKPTVHLYTSRREWAGFHQKGSSGKGWNWAMRSPWQREPPQCRAWGECGREFHAEVV